MNGRNNHNDPSSDIEMRRNDGSENEAAADASGSTGVYHSMAEPKTEHANKDMADSYDEMSLSEKLEVQAGEIILNHQWKIICCRSMCSCIFHL
jgi:hypothetical protein